MGKFSLSKIIRSVFVFCAAAASASSAQTFTTLVNFDDYTNGAEPYSPLIQATDGNLYGTTRVGWASDLGTVFKITPGGTVTTVYSFCPQNGCTDGFGPYAGLVQATDGNFYGTTLVGGTGCNGGSCGTVFKITPGGTLTTLHSFDGTDGKYPYDGLVQANNAIFYGTTNFGGDLACNAPDGCGTVFSLDVGLGVPLTVTTVGSGMVTSSDGSINCGSACSSNYKSGRVVTLTATPASGWAFSGWSGCNATRGNVCVVTMNNARTVTAKFAVGYVLSASTIGNGIIISGDGNINCGSVCSYSYPSGSTLALTAMPGIGSTLYSFGGTDGYLPHAGLVQATDGNLYGTTQGGGTSANCSSGCGTVFKIILGGTLTTLHSFDNTDGSTPYEGWCKPPTGTSTAQRFSAGPRVMARSSKLPLGAR